MRPGSKTFIACLLFVALSGCDDVCSSEVLGTSRGPNGVVARLEKKDCGATVAYVYEVRTIDRDGANNIVLRFDDGHNTNWPSDDAKLMDVRWRGSALQLNVHVPVRVFKHLSAANGLTIMYGFAPGTEI